MTLRTGPWTDREFSSADEMIAHYRDVRQRMEAPGWAFQRRAAEERRAAEAAAEAERRRRKAELEAAAVERATALGRSPVRAIICKVATEHGLTYADIIRPGRCTAAVRWQAIAAVHAAYPGRSLPWLGKQFNRDHTTILHALRKMGLRP